MRDRYLIFLIVLVAAIHSCKQKPAHDKALEYYVAIQLQTKAVMGMVKEFSPEIAKFIKKKGSIKEPVSAEQFAKFKNRFTELINKVDERYSTVKKITPYAYGDIIQLYSGIVITDIRELMVSISNYVNASHVGLLSSKQMQLKRSDLRVRYFMLVSDGKQFLFWSETYKSKYHLTDTELAKYALK